MLAVVLVKGHQRFAFVLGVAFALELREAFACGFTGAIVRFSVSFLTGWWWNGTRSFSPFTRTMEAKVVGMIRYAEPPHFGHFEGASDFAIEPSASKTFLSFSQ